MSETNPTYYKVLVRGKSCHGGDMAWPLPNGKPGQWVSHNDSCVVCSSGLHATTKPFRWYKWDCDCYEAEIGEVFGRNEDKVVTNKMRLIRKVEHPTWWTDAISFVNSIKGIGWFSNQELPRNFIPKVKLCDSWDAAWAAAGAAAWDAARAAAGDAAGAAAWAAAWAAARDAAWAAARDAAGDAARDAARDAAWDAARDAGLKARLIITQDLAVAQKYRYHAKLRWQMWELGYGVACDVNGILYCYKNP